MTSARILAVWVLLAVLMSLNGILREKVFVRIARRQVAEVLSATSGVLIILGVSRAFLSKASDGHGANSGRVAGTWLFLTVAFEFLFGHYIDKKSWSELAGNYALWRGRLWPLVLLSVALAPFLWMRQRDEALP